MKIAFSGTHGTGKTTAVFEKAKELKLKYPNKKVGVLSENVINCPLPINRETTLQSQLWMFADQLKKEIELSLKFDVLVCDRSLFDYVAYTWRIDEEAGKTLFQLSLKLVDTYDVIYFKRLKNNDFAFEDGLRDTDEEFRRQIDKLLEKIFFKVKSMGARVKVIEI